MHAGNLIVQRSALLTLSPSAREEEYYWTRRDVSVAVAVKKPV